MNAFVESIKQHPGQQQVDLEVQPARLAPLASAPKLRVQPPPSLAPTRQVPATGPVRLSRIVKLHYNWQYPFLRPSKSAIVKRYNDKFRPTIVARKAWRKEAAAAVAAAAAPVGNTSAADAAPAAEA